MKLYIFSFICGPFEFPLLDHIFGLFFLSCLSSSYRLLRYFMYWRCYSFLLYKCFKNFLQICVLLFTLFEVILWAKEVFTFNYIKMMNHLICFKNVWVLFKYLCHTKVYEDILLMWLQKTYRVVFHICRFSSSCSFWVVSQKIQLLFIFFSHVDNWLYQTHDFANDLQNLLSDFLHFCFYFSLLLCSSVLFICLASF